MVRNPRLIITDTRDLASQDPAAQWISRPRPLSNRRLEAVRCALRQIASTARQLIARHSTRGDHIGPVICTLHGRSFHDPGTSPIAPPLSAVVERLGRAILPWCITPAQFIAVEEDNPGQNRLSWTCGLPWLFEPKGRNRSIRSSVSQNKLLLNMASFQSLKYDIRLKSMGLKLKPLRTRHNSPIGYNGLDFMKCLAGPTVSGYFVSALGVPNTLKQEISQLRSQKTRPPDQLAMELTRRRDTRFRISRLENGPGRTACRSISINLGIGSAERTSEGSRWTNRWPQNPSQTAKSHPLLRPMPVVRSAGIVPPCCARTASRGPARHRDFRQRGATRRGHWQSLAAYR